MVKRYLPEVVAAALDLVPGSDGNWIGRCPHPDHEDNNPSFCLKFNEITGEYIVHCFVCPDPAAVFKAAEGRIEKFLADNDGQVKIATSLSSLRSFASKASKQKIAMDIWDEARKNPTDEVMAYFRGRGLSGGIPDSIRQKSLEYVHGSGIEYPCLVAEVVDLDLNTIGIHRIFLNIGDDGTVAKADVNSPKKSLGSISGNAVWVFR